MSEVEKTFEEWKQREDKVVEIDGKTYYRIIWSDVFKLSCFEKPVIGVVCGETMPGGRIFQDENGNHFEFFGFLTVLHDVRQKIVGAMAFTLKWHETKEIGEYLTVWR